MIILIRRRNAIGSSSTRLGEAAARCRERGVDDVAGEDAEHQADDDVAGQAVDGIDELLESAEPARAARRRRRCDTTQNGEAMRLDVAQQPLHRDERHDGRHHEAHAELGPVLLCRSGRCDTGSAPRTRSPRTWSGCRRRNANSAAAGRDVMPASIAAKMRGGRARRAGKYRGEDLRRRRPSARPARSARRCTGWRAA